PAISVRQQYVWLPVGAPVALSAPVGTTEVPQYGLSACERLSLGPHSPGRGSECPHRGRQKVRGASHNEVMDPILQQAGVGLGVPDVDKFQPLLSAEFLRIAQALGFSFKQAIGQPLTEVAAAQIAQRLAPGSGTVTQSRPKR